MLVFDGNECIATAETDDEALYVIRRQDLASGNDKKDSISVLLSVPSGPRENTKACEATSIKVISSIPSGSKKDTTIMQSSTACVYPATASLQATLDSQENASPPPDVVTASLQATLKGDDAVKQIEGKEKEKIDESNKQETAKAR